jgi:hypothetical protein
MIFSIDRHTRLRDLQAAFANVFSYLRLEFFRKPVQPYLPSPKTDMRSPDEIALSADWSHTVAELAINSHWKVSEVEELFASEAGLYVQVFRKSGNLWIETTFTDDWTLEQQNNEGELLSTPFPSRSNDTNGQRL